MIAGLSEGVGVLIVCGDEPPEDMTVVFVLSIATLVPLVDDFKSLFSLEDLIRFSPESILTFGDDRSLDSFLPDP